MGPSKSSTYFTAFSTFFFFPVSLFDLEARFFVPTHTCWTPARTGAVKAGRRSASASRSVVSRPRLDSPEHGGTLAMVGMTCPRGARCRARSSIAPQPCIRSIREDRTMMQSCASVAKLRGGGSILHSGLEAMVLRRITATSDRHRQTLAWAAKLLSCCPYLSMLSLMMPDVRRCHPTLRPS